jgi:hypothetical protein
MCLNRSRKTGNGAIWEEFDGTVTFRVHRDLASVRPMLIAQSSMPSTAGVGTSA